MKTYIRTNLESGRWVEDLSEYDKHYPKHIQALYRCSECNKKEPRKTYYCPHCGAKMQNGCE